MSVILRLSAVRALTITSRSHARSKGGIASGQNQQRDFFGDTYHKVVSLDARAEFSTRIVGDARTTAARVVPVDLPGSFIEGIAYAPDTATVDKREAPDETHFPLAGGPS